MFKPEKKSLQQEKLKALILLGGRYWIRTSDPLLVRQVL